MHRAELCDTNGSVEMRTEVFTCEKSEVRIMTFLFLFCHSSESFFFSSLCHNCWHIINFCLICCWGVSSLCSFSEPLPDTLTHRNMLKISVGHPPLGSVCVCVFSFGDHIPMNTSLSLNLSLSKLSIIMLASCKSNLHGRFLKIQSTINE